MPEINHNTIPREVGQGIIEYALIGLLIALVVVVVVILLLPVLQGDPCFLKSESIECRDYKVQQCIALERYTLEQCIDLAVGRTK